jgi:putative hydrolase of the HAD superfamily
MPRYRAVLFDFFGTITKAVARGPAHMAVARHLGCDPREYTQQLDRTFPDRAKGSYGPPRDALGWITRVLGARPDHATMTAALIARVDAIRADTRLRADAVPVLRALRRRGVRTAVVSDCGPELPLFLPFLPVAPLLDACVYSIRLGAAKPEPAIYLAACDRLRVAPDECLYIGDGGSRELTGARALGMDAVRLAAPDLVGHLTFGAERGWAGPTAYSLTDAVAGCLDGELTAA